VKIAFVIPDYFEAKIQKVVNEMQAEISVEYLIYKNYKEAPDLIMGKQQQYDGIIFAGKAPYNFSRKEISPEVPWGYFRAESRNLYRALLIALNKGWDISKLSIDSYTQAEIQEALKDIGMEKANMPNKIYVSDVVDPTHDDKTIQFHLRNMAEGNTSGCLTRLYTVAEELEKKKVPVVFVVPSYGDILEEIHKMIALINTKLIANSSIVVMQIQLLMSLDAADDFVSESIYCQETNRLFEYIFVYAKRIGGTVINLGTNEFIIMVERGSIETDTKGYTHLDLLDKLSESKLYTIHIGIGCGDTILRARRSAQMALVRLSKDDRDVALCMKSNTAMATIYPVKPVRNDRKSIDEILQNISKNTGISVSTIYDIYSFVSEQRADYFTASDLSNYLKISIRNTNRVLERLENKNYVCIYGYINGRNGRPSRKIHFCPEGIQMESRD
jgi:hypothetical protein